MNDLLAGWTLIRLPMVLMLGFGMMLLLHSNIRAVRWLGVFSALVYYVYIVLNPIPPTLSQGLIPSLSFFLFALAFVIQTILPHAKIVDDPVRDWAAKKRLKREVEGIESLGSK